MLVHELITWLSMNCKGADLVNIDHEPMLEEDLQWNWRGELNISSTFAYSRADKRHIADREVPLINLDTPHTSPDE